MNRSGHLLARELLILKIPTRLAEDGVARTRADHVLGFAFANTLGCLALIPVIAAPVANNVTRHNRAVAVFVVEAVVTATGTGIDPIASFGLT